MGEDYSAELERDKEASHEGAGGVQVDLFGVKMRAAPKAPPVPEDLAWRRVIKGVYRDLKRVIAAVPRLAASTLEGVERLVAGVCDLPAAIARRVEAAHQAHDAVEAERQATAERGGVQDGVEATEQAVRVLREVVARLRAKGLQVLMDKGPGGELLIRVAAVERQSVVDAGLVRELGRLAELRELSASAALDDALDRGVESLGLEARIEQALRIAEIRTLATLVGLTALEVRQRAVIDDDAMCEVIEALRARGLFLQES